jgi:hypothetical protein
MTAREHDEPTWFKSSRSAGNGACVEVAVTAAHIGVRDSKNRTGPALAVDRQAWREFILAVRSGHFDL